MAFHNSELSLGRARSCSNVEPVANRSERRSTSTTAHIHVPDIVFEIRIGHAAEPESFIEPLEVPLRSNSNFRAPPRFLDEPDGLIHQSLPRSGASYIRMCAHSPDRCFSILRF